MADRVLANLWQTQRSLLKWHTQGSSARRVNVPSDDPAGTMSILRYRSSLSELERYASSAAEAHEWITVSDEAIVHLQNNLHRVREIAVLGANGSLPPDARTAYTAELEEIIRHVVTIANSSYDGRFVFGGHETTQPPFVQDATGVAYNGDQGEILREVGRGVNLTINVPGDELFGTVALDAGGNVVGGQGVFHLLARLKEEIEAGNVAQVSALLEDLNQVQELVNNYQVKLGATGRRALQVMDQVRDVRITMETLLSNIEDADVAEVTMRLATAEASYRYALAVGARIMQPSLVEYLR